MELVFEKKQKNCFKNPNLKEMKGLTLEKMKAFSKEVLDRNQMANI
ncbi:hypothetical protein SAMN04487988_111130 [Algoriphagus hitonicola]|uniref:Uncharacterized protein n=1 Tax=Algoriphagus hitonicola TaxID=435880 RepID=A0A1I2W5P1_9BACT|nr:hypothetical protein SAMN04487988_111130 [Algoriphagus hitonicola]